MLWLVSIYSSKFYIDNQQNYGNLLWIWLTWWMDNQHVKLVSIGTIILLTLVGVIPTMDSVKNGFQARI